MIAANEAKAKVYVQKPASGDVVEGQAMVAAARQNGRVVQVGTQRWAFTEYGNGIMADLRF